MIIFTMMIWGGGTGVTLRSLKAHPMMIVSTFRLFLGCYVVLFLIMGIFVHGIDVDLLLSKMTLEEKIGQMVQIDISKFMNSTTGTVDYPKMQLWIEKYFIGSILNSPFSGGKVNGASGWTASQWRELIFQMQTYAQNTPNKIPVIYGIDTIHGGTFIKGAALFPQSINLGASFDTTIVYQSSAVAAKDTRAAGIPWLFSPVLGLGLHPLWARFSETFGEDMYLAAEMGAATITGMQDVVADGGVPSRAAACMKHFIAYSKPVNGHDRSPIELADRLMRELYVPSFQAAVDAGVLSAMEQYGANIHSIMHSIDQYDYAGDYFGHCNYLCRGRRRRADGKLFSVFEDPAAPRDELHRHDGHGLLGD
jgi:hypothetical protein